MTHPSDEAWSAALLDEWDACERWAVEEAGAAPSDESVGVVELSRPSPVDPIAVRDILVGLEQRHDNTAVAVKVALRKTALGWLESPSVLELCCGMGRMWAWVYRDLPYHGVDEARIFSPRLCDLARAEEWVEEHDLSPYTMIDVDTYGEPWQIVGRALARSPHKRIVIVATCGVQQVFKRGGQAGHLVRWYGSRSGERVQAGGLLYYHYRDAVQAWIAEQAKARGSVVTETLRGDNGRQGSDTNYWAFRLEAA